MRRALLLALGLLAELSTVALLCDCAVLAAHVSAGTLVRSTSAIAATLQAIVWLMLSFFVSTTFVKSLSSLLRRSSVRRLTASFGCAILACVFAAAMSVANIVCLGDEEGDGELENSKGAFLTASSVLLAITFICQATFLVVYYLACRRSSLGEADSLHTDEDSKLSPKSRVKSIPYSRTQPSMTENRGMASMDYVDMRSLDGARSPVQVSGSPRSSMSQSIHPTTSKTRLLALKEKGRLPSLDSSIYRSSGDDSDPWDASPPTHPKHRFLETIPASPMLPRNPSLDSASDLEPPAPIRQRSRSYSPVARAPRQMMMQSPNASSDELHIHPLFRSDSPTPPPMATPGTSVMASPDAGKVIPHRPSNPSLRRIRSSSLASASSPLSRRNSFEAPSLKKAVDEQDSILEVDESEATETEELAPPIPEFVMGAGSRSSLSRYNSKKQEPE